MGINNKDSLLLQYHKIFIKSKSMSNKEASKNILLYNIFNLVQTVTIDRKYIIL